MKKSNIIWLIITFFGSVSIVVVLYGFMTFANKSKGTFIRHFPSHMLSPFVHMDLKYSSYYICGEMNGKIYLANYTAPTYFLLTDTRLKDSQILQLNSIVKSPISGYSRAQIDSPFIILMDPLKSTVKIIKYPELQERDLKMRSFNWSYSLALSPSSYVLKKYDTSLRRDILSKESNSGKSITDAPDILTKQIDGIFCEDGTLQYNRLANKLLYVYYYRNQFICLDTNLSILYKGKTLDTISQANLKIATIASENKSVISAPASLVNKYAVIYNNNIYINSCNQAKNEDKEMFSKYNVIDIYSLVNGHYKYSFYIPKYQQETISDFNIINDSLIVINGNYLSTARINNIAQ